MIYILNNLVPILGATLAGLLFGLGWLKAFGRLGASTTLSLPFALVAVVAEFWLASILAGALILAPPQAGKWTMTIATPIVIWIGFIVPTLVVTLGRRGIRTGAVLLECGHWLGTMVIQAVVLQLIGLSAPGAS